MISIDIHFKFSIFLPEILIVIDDGTEKWNGLGEFRFFRGDN
jgi:hypothetical protein